MNFLKRIVLILVPVIAIVGCGGSEDQSEAEKEIRGNIESPDAYGYDGYCAEVDAFGGISEYVNAEPGEEVEWSLDGDLMTTTVDWETSEEEAEALAVIYRTECE